MHRRSRSAAFSMTLLLAVLLGPATIVVPSVQARTFKVLYAFTGGANGENPDDIGGLVLDKNGIIYGTAAGGNTNCPYLTSCGIVFELAKTGTETVLYTFLGGTDGAGPIAGLIQDNSGNLYGTTYYGGTGQCKVEKTVVGCGTVFQLSPPITGGRAWTETVLYSFQGMDGASPVASLVRDESGNFYGTTTIGGAGNCRGGGGQQGCGTIFKLDSTGKETVLYSFTSKTDGGYPNAGLVRDTAGTMYGTTASGGNLTQACGSVGCGVVFKVDQTGNETVLYSFTGTGGDGTQPYYGTLVRDSAGSLYGTTTYGGYGNGYGIVFKVSKQGKETVLYSFKGSRDGGYPFGGLARDAAGNLYGTTSDWGKAGFGTVFKLSRTGTFIVLHGFTGQDGAFPVGNLVRDALGNLYGVASNGGAYYYGTVFKAKPGR